MAKMSESDLTALLDSKITNAIGYQGGKLSQERQKADRYYNGEPFGNELEGRSQVVARTVAEAVDGKMPSLMKIFSSGDEVVKFEPEGPEDEEAAKQATDYVNWIWNKQNDGFANFFTWFKDALLKKTAVVKIWWDESIKNEKETYEGLSEDEFNTLLADPDLELTEHTEYPDPNGAAAPPSGAMPGAGPMSMPSAPAAPPMSPPQAGPMGASPMGAAGPGMMPPAPVSPSPPMLHDAVFRRIRDESQVRIMAVPPDEFLIDRRAVSLDEVPFTAHRRKTTASELKELYPKKAKEIDAIPMADDGEYTLERLERFHQEDESPFRDDTAVDPSMRELWITECYIKTDYDGDGIAELRLVTVAGAGNVLGPVLENEEIDDLPWASVTPIPMPHKFFGMSIADQTMDLQLISSTLERGALDSMYLANAPQIGAVEGMVNLDDLLNRRPGGVVRIKQADALVPIPNPVVVNEAFQMLGYIDSVAERRTGIQRFTSGPAAGSLNDAYTDTATGVNATETASQERIELIARVFAETGVRRAFRRIFELICKHQQKAKIIKLRNHWVSMNPAEWNDQMKLTVHVGLGTGNKNQLVGIMSNLLQVSEKIIQMQGGVQGPLVTAENVYNQLAKLIEASGLKSAVPFFTDPKEAGPMQGPQQHPDPKAQAEMARVQQEPDIERMKATINANKEIQIAHIRAAADIEVARVNAASDNGAAAYAAQIAATTDMHATQTQADTDLQTAHMGNQANVAQAHLGNLASTAQAANQPEPAP